MYIYINVDLKQTQQFKSTILHFKIKIKKKKTYVSSPAWREL